jgi:hypothetical protein
MRDKIFLLIPVTTVVLAVAFLTPNSPGTRTVYQSVNGKTWSMRQPDPVTTTPTAAVVTVSTAAPAAAPALAVKPEPQPVKARAKRARHAAAPRALTARIVSAPQTNRELQPALSSGTAASVTTSASSQAYSGAPPEYALEDIADRFESDESKFPLDRSTEAGGVALHLIGLEKLPAMFVLKVAVVNSGDADFFVKEFAVKVGNQILSSRSDFRVLVEPQRTREGYVLFERPPSGSNVRINLKEDGGKGRALETAIPYPF